jgi:integrase
MYSTIDTYVGYIGPTVGRCSDWRSVTCAARIAHADETGVNVAVEIDLAEVRKIHCRLSGIHRHAFWFMVVSSARLKDITRLRRCQMFFKGRTLRIQWRVTKQRRQRWHRLYTHHRTGHLAQNKETAAFFAAVGSESKPFAGVTTESLNRAIKTALSELGWTKKIRTYSLRHFAIDRLFLECKGDAEKVIKSTGHMRASTVTAYYQRWYERTAQ